jgi:hypothetical protein
MHLLDEVREIKKRLSINVDNSESWWDLPD